MKFNCKNLLVTGGAGFIGSNFIKYIFEKYEDLNIINYDLLTYSSNIDFLNELSSDSRYKFIKGDICDYNSLSNIFKEYNIDGVVNFAAESHVDNSIENPEIFIKTNVNGVFNLLQIAREYWMEAPFKYLTKFQNARFHQVSTDEVYGSILDGSFSEEDRYAPNSPYSASKASADMLVRSFNKTYGLNTTISVSSNNFGENQNSEKFIPKIIQNILNNTQIPVYGDGLNVRDWIYVADNCNAIDIIFNSGKSGNIYNVGGNKELTNLEIINIIHKIISKKCKVQEIKLNFIEDRYGHDRRYSLKLDKISKELGWLPTYNFESALKNYINYCIK